MFEKENIYSFGWTGDSTYFISCTCSPYILFTYIYLINEQRYTIKDVFRLRNEQINYCIRDYK